MKNFVLDTNVILHDCQSIEKFEENVVILPITVLEEIDHFKKDMNELGRNARQFSRMLDSLRETGSLAQGVTVNKQGGILRVSFCNSAAQALMPADMDLTIADNRILAVALYEKSIAQGSDRISRTVLVSQDTNVRIKADTLGLDAETYENGAVSIPELYTGRSSAEVAPSIIEALYVDNKVDWWLTGLEEPYPNQCVVLKNGDNSKQAVLCRYNSVMKEYRRLPEDLTTVGLTPRSAEQQFALDLLLDPEIPLVSIMGLAGSGKTLCALAAGLHGVLESKTYKKILLLKPTVAMGNANQLGFLPGALDEKLAPFMASYYDNLEFLMGGSKQYSEPIKTRGKKKKIADDWDEEKSVGRISVAQELIANGYLELGSLEHIRGRSLPGQYIIVDESANISPSSMKTILTRAGEGSKIVLLGDIEQIDAVYLSAENNALTHVIDRMKGEDIYGHITLTKSERSKLAERAAQLL